MSATTKKKTNRPKVDRRPYKHAADTRDALLALHRVLEELGEEGRPAFMPLGFGVGEKDVTSFCPVSLMIKSWEITEYAEKLRAAARRVMVAKYGLRGARRFDGWRRGQWLGSPTYRNPLEIAAEKRRKAKAGAA